MAPLQLHVKLSSDDAIEVEIDDGETVEALAVVIYSLRPDAGEEMRLVQKGRILKRSQDIAELGLKSGDSIAVAKKFRKVSSGTDVEAPADGAACARAADAAPTDMVLDAQAAPVPAPAPPAAPSDPAPAAAAEAPPAAKEPPDAAAAPAAPVRATEVEAASPAPASAAVATEPTPPEAAEREGGETVAKAVSQEAEAPSSPSQLGEPAIDVSADGLRAFAARLERGGAPPAPDALAAAMREAAARMEKFENVSTDFAQALHMLHVVAGRTLQEGIGKLSGEKVSADPDAHPGAQSDGTRSFLMKRGDADVQEMHRAASAPVSNVTGSGSLGGGTQPLSKEEMAKARNARLALLEAQQAEKQKEKEDAEERGKAREAMFNRPFAGTQKQLGKL